MSITQREMNCAPPDVFGVLSDGWLYGLWVVGASRIRDVDKSWPNPAAKIHHSVGSWPMLLNDTTSVTAYTPGRSIRLQARAWPAGEADVQIEVEQTPDGCRVRITEDVAKGPGRLIPKRLRDPVLHWRNTESLRRLSYLAEQRAASADSQ